MRRAHGTNPEVQKGKLSTLFESAIDTLKDVATASGMAVGATVVAVAGPAFVENISQRAGVEISLPGGEGEAFAEEVCTLINPDGTCAEWVTIDTTAPTGGGGGNGGGTGGGGGGNGGGTGGGGGGNGGGTPQKTWDQLVAEQCASTPNLVEEANKLKALQGTDGSGRLVTYVLECGISFVGDPIADLQRPITNVEQAILDANNNMTPNVAQVNELLAYINFVLLPDSPYATTTTTTSKPASTTTTVETAETVVDTTIGVVDTVADTVVESVPADTTKKPLDTPPSTVESGEGVVSSGNEDDSSGPSTGWVAAGAAIIALGAGGTILFQKHRGSLAKSAKIKTA